MANRRTLCIPLGEGLYLDSEETAGSRITHFDDSAGRVDSLELLGGIVPWIDDNLDIRVLLKEGRQDGVQLLAQRD